LNEFLTRKRGNGQKENQTKNRKVATVDGYSKKTGNKRRKKRRKKGEKKQKKRRKKGGKKEEKKRKS
jgi:hypothetical protein